MIVGNGLMATAMKKIDDNDLLIFASGVSNSNETNSKEYKREYNLLKKHIEEYPNKKLIYFSTCGIYDKCKKESEYIKFKLRIEKYIQENVVNFIIFRLGNVVGKGGNPNTLINFFKNCIVNNTEFYLYSKGKRLLIDVDDVVKFIDLYKNNFSNEIVDLYYPYQFLLLSVFQKVRNKMGGGRYLSTKKYRNSI